MLPIGWQDPLYEVPHQASQASCPVIGWRSITQRNYESNPTSTGFIHPPVLPFEQGFIQYRCAGVSVNALCEKVCLHADKLCPRSLQRRGNVLRWKKKKKNETPLHSLFPVSDFHSLFVYQGILCQLYVYTKKYSSINCTRIIWLKKRLRVAFPSTLSDVAQCLQTFPSKDFPRDPNHRADSVRLSVERNRCCLSCPTAWFVTFSCLKCAFNQPVFADSQCYLGLNVPKETPLWVLAVFVTWSWASADTQEQR